MKVEGRKTIDYLRVGRWHLIVLIVWSIFGFIFAVSTNMTMAAVGTKMALTAPFLMALVFGHLGYSIAKARKFRKTAQAVHGGKLVGCISGFIAGLFMINEPVAGASIVNTLFEGSVKNIFLVTICAGIVVGALRAIYGALFAALGAVIGRKVG